MLRVLEWAMSSLLDYIVVLRSCDDRYQHLVSYFGRTKV